MDLQKLINKTTQNKYVFGVSLSVDYKGKKWTGVSGNFSLDEPYFIASTTKLFVTAIILKLRDNGKLKLTDKISHYLPREFMHSLHVLNGTDRSQDIEIHHLLAHTSGLPDYFQKKPEIGKSLEDRLMTGDDMAWDTPQVVEWSKAMKPLFIPGTKGKAHYSDTNFHLLAKIIENCFDAQFNDLVQSQICEPLGMKQTYMYEDVKDTRPKSMYYRLETLKIPKAMASFGPDGGIVSTSEDMQLFLKAFMGGQLFPKSYLQEMRTWNKVMFPLESGVGMLRFKTPWYFSPFTRIPEMIGHSGLSGAFAFYLPDKDIYLTGTVNQIYRPGTAFKLMIQAIAAIMKSQ